MVFPCHFPGSLVVTHNLCLFLEANVVLARGGGLRGVFIGKQNLMAFYGPKCLIFTFSVTVRKTLIIQKLLK